VLDDLVLQLMDKETLSKHQVIDIFAPIEKRPAAPSYSGYGKRLPSDRPPVLTPKELALMGPKDVQDLTQGNGSGSSRSTAEHEVEQDDREGPA
jgi:cell division protease FtsH